ncbi:DUF4238 domain-containing protein [Arthrobacter echini]|uniref:DUF4238 domain-containing protein n=1 Tax=Arthrobacter echini TaxID=1529066 RepID=A0A5D0XGW0_9MICC|nr:DUF4238 domain-containing protein [Arthrobacter echini]TYC95862.1 DUF4238 domain-containing protein [Arthrobacter echini]
MPTARRHHTVPNFYLKGFATTGAEPTIGTVGLKDGRRFRSATSNATVWRNFYSIVGHPAGEDVFEQALSEIEGKAAGVIRQVAEGVWPLPTEEREILATFIAFQFLRGPDTRASLSQMESGLARVMFTAMGKEGLTREFERMGKEVDEETLDKLLVQAADPDGLKMQTTPLGHIVQILELVPSILPFIIGRPWLLYRFERKTLLTCDTPVSLIRNPNFAEIEMGVGVFTAWGITVPLTRNIGLLLSDPTPTFEGITDEAEKRAVAESNATGVSDAEIPPTTAMAKLFNSHTIANTRQWLFHHPDDVGLVPDELPEPREQEVNFSGQPW